MNNYELDTLFAICENPKASQRILASQTGFSLGKINACVAKLMEEGFLDKPNHPTHKALNLWQDSTPKNAIILAAGYGLRMVPLNTEIPKGLLEVHGEPLIERTIRQLREAGITDISIVVGYQKEKYEYLIDEYQVDLIVNMEYSTKNNLHSLKRAMHKLGNTYIIPCDLWSESNPYCSHEPYTWYMVSDRMTDKSTVKINRQMELVPISSEDLGNAMLGIAYLTEDDSERLRSEITKRSSKPAYDHTFWEDTLFEIPEVIVRAHKVSAEHVVEIDTFEQLRALDSESEQLKTSAMSIIADTFHTTIDQITHIETLKKGMTNRSFLFTCRGERYIMRIPGEGTDLLINRQGEASVYQALSGRGICDDVLYMNPDNGYKITRFLEGYHNCDPDNEAELKACMQKLKAFHAKKLQVPHTFDLFGQIEYYEKLWNGRPSVYRDYQKTKAQVLELKAYIDAQPKDWCLTHIDAVPDNFLLPDNFELSNSFPLSDHYPLPDQTGVTSEQDIRLIDWEYAGMQDPHVDIAMFCIYALYDRKQVDRLIDLYFEDACPEATRIKIYCYIAVCGLLWSNWCEYKSQLGIEFGEYALRQYRYAKDYYKLVRSYL